LQILEVDGAGVELSLKEAEKREAIANAAAADAVHEMQKWQDLANAASLKAAQAEEKGRLAEERVGELEQKVAADATTAEVARETAAKKSEMLKQQVLRLDIMPAVHTMRSRSTHTMRS
jgi:hypothetical protein